MEFLHSVNCAHCRLGCDHPHDEDDPIVTDLELSWTWGLAVRGSKMRHGGTFVDPATGIELASDNWVQARCSLCGAEARTPVEIVPPLTPRDHDGAVLMQCAPCIADLATGHSPGHNRRRRRHRHG